MALFSLSSSSKSLLVAIALLLQLVTKRTVAFVSPINQDVSFKSNHHARFIKTHSLEMKVAGDRERIVVNPDFKVAGGFFSAGLALAAADNGAGFPLMLIGAFLGSQTTKIRFVFDDEAFEVKVQKGDAEDLEDSRDNFAVGGKNRWKYDTFTHWQFYPSEEFPILVYFKETQTSPEGQIHFFPVLADGKMLRDTMVAKAIPRIEAGGGKE